MHATLPAFTPPPLWSASSRHPPLRKDRCSLAIIHDPIEELWAESCVRFAACLIVLLQPLDQHLALSLFSRTVEDGLRAGVATHEHRGGATR